jgi:hemolysin III
MTLARSKSASKAAMKTINGMVDTKARAGREKPRPLSRGERIADAWVHGLALALGLVGVVVLMAAAVPQGNVILTVSLLVYGCGLLAMLICSALYNASRAPKRRDRLRRLDHAAIFVMIAGTYTPFLAVKINGIWGHWLLVYVWTVAGVGVVLKLMWVNRFARLSVVLYLFLGWTIVVAIEPVLASISPPAILLLVIGGVLYSIGVLFHLWEQLPYQQAIWHGFVAAAAVCHYAAIMGDVALPGNFT